MIRCCTRNCGIEGRNHGVSEATVSMADKSESPLALAHATTKSDPATTIMPRSHEHILCCLQLNSQHHKAGELPTAPLHESWLHLYPSSRGSHSVSCGPTPTWLLSSLIPVFSALNFEFCRITEASYHHTTIQVTGLGTLE